MISVRNPICTVESWFCIEVIQASRRNRGFDLLPPDALDLCVILPLRGLQGPFEGDYDSQVCEQG